MRKGPANAQPRNESRFTGSFPTERKDAEEKVRQPLQYARRKAVETREALAKSWLRSSSGKGGKAA